MTFCPHNNAAECDCVVVPVDPVPPRELAGILLDEAKAIIGVGGDRHKDYGDHYENFDNIARLWAVILGVEVTPEQIALCMAQVKIARLMYSPDHRDSWNDAMGYLALGGDIALRPDRHR